MMRTPFLSIGFAERRLVWQVGAAPSEAQPAPPPVEVPLDASAGAPEVPDEAAVDAAPQLADDFVAEAEAESINDTQNLENSTLESLQLMMDQLKQQGKEYDEAFAEVKSKCPDAFKDRLSYRNDKGKISFNVPQKPPEQPAPQVEAPQPAVEAPAAEKPAESSPDWQTKLLRIPMSPEDRAAISASLENADPAVQKQCGKLVEYMSGNAAQREAMVTALKKFNNSSADLALVTRSIAQPGSLSPEEKQRAEQLSTDLGLSEGDKQQLAILGGMMNEGGGMLGGLTAEIDQKVQDAMVEKAKLVLDKVDISSMTVAEKELKKAEIMVAHGVGVVEEKGKLVAKAPTNNLEKMMNHFMGIVMFFSALGQKMKDVKDGVKGEKNEAGTTISPDKAKNEAIAACDALKAKNGKWVDATAVPDGEAGAKYRELADGRVYKKGADGNITRLNAATGGFEDVFAGTSITDEAIKKEVTALLALEDPVNWSDIPSEKGGIVGCKYKQSLDALMYRKQPNGRVQELRSGKWKEIMIDQGKLAELPNSTIWTDIQGNGWQYRNYDGKTFAKIQNAGATYVNVMKPDGSYQDVAEGVPVPADQAIVRELYATADPAKGIDKGGIHYMMNSDGKIVSSQENVAMGTTEYKMYTLHLGDPTKCKWDSVDKATAKV